MIKSILAPQSPMVKLFFLLVLSIAGLSVSLFFASLLIKLLWGFNYINNPDVLGDLSDPFVVDANRFLLLFQHIGFFILPGIIFLYLSEKKPKSFILLSRQFQLSKLLLVVFILISIMPFVNLLISWNEAMHLPEFMAAIESTMRDMENSAMRLTDALVNMETPMDLFYLTLLVAVLPAIGEELMFRGIIQRLFSQQFNSYHIGIWASAFFFSAMHFQFFGFFPRLLLGAVLGYLLVYSGNIIYPMLGHFINNFSSLLIAYLIQHQMISPEIENIGADQDWLFVVPSILITGLLFFILWRKRDMQLIEEYSLVNESSKISD
jgi:membrane protease YdiL (CAAX protease family)